jgi:hypothetical protein
MKSIIGISVRPEHAHSWQYLHVTGGHDPLQVREDVKTASRRKPMHASLVLGEGDSAQFAVFNGEAPLGDVHTVRMENGKVFVDNKRLRIFPLRTTDERIRVVRQWF